MVVFMFGLAPVSEGFVDTSVTALDISGGNRLRRLNLMKGFFTGIRPKD